MKRVWNYVVTMWQPASAFVLISLILVVLFSFRLATLVTGTAEIERDTRVSSQSISNILDNPIDAPYRLAQFAGQQIHESIIVERLISGVIAGISVILFFYIVRRFCNFHATIFATILYGTSSSLLVSGRLASAQISLLLLFILSVCGYRLITNSNRYRYMILAVIVLALALYSPGLLYFIVAGAIWQFKNLKNSVRKLSALQIVLSSILFIALVTPLLLGLFESQGLWREYLGIPNTTPSVIDFIKNVAAVPAGVIAFAPYNPLFRLGKQPVLDAFTAVVLIVGIYDVFKRFRLDRFKLLAGVFIIATLYTAVAGNYENSFILLPFIYLTVAIGLSYLLTEWNKTFPNNPLAKWLAVIVMTLAVIVSSNYQTRRYFIAWPNNIQTREIFTLE